VVNCLIKSKSNSRASCDGESGGLGSVGLRASVATDVVAGDIGHWAVVVGVQAHILIVRGGGAVGDELRPAVVSESSVRKSQQAACGCEVEVHSSGFEAQYYWYDRLKLSCCV
jgi:hypothetical protein